MKKYSLLVFFLAFCCIGCREIKESQTQTLTWMESNEKLKVLCTTQCVASLVRSVGGDGVSVLTLMSRSADPHSYEMVKGDDEKFRRADAIFSSGLGLEAGTTLARSLVKYRAIPLADDIAHRTGCAIVVDQVPDPHIWMDPSLWAEGVWAIEQIFSRLRPEKAEQFHRNAVDTQKRLLEVHHRIALKMAKIPPERRYLVTTHDAFRYFCRAYLGTIDDDWRGRSMAPEGLSPESQMSLQDLRAVVGYIHAHGVRVVCPEQGTNRASLLKVVDVCEHNGDRVRISSDTLFSDTIGPGLTYEETMDHNATVISRAFEGL